MSHSPAGQLLPILTGTAALAVLPAATLGAEAPDRRQGLMSLAFRPVAILFALNLQGVAQVATGAMLLGASLRCLTAVANCAQNSAPSTQLRCRNGSSDSKPCSPQRLAMNTWRKSLASRLCAISWRVSCLRLTYARCELPARSGRPWDAEAFARRQDVAQPSWPAASDFDGHSSASGSSQAETGAAERVPFLCRGPRKSPLSRLASGPQLPADARENRPKIRFLHPPHARHGREVTTLGLSSFADGKGYSQSQC